MSFYDDAAAAWTNAGGPPALAPIMAAIAAAESTNGTQLYGDQAYSGTGAPSSFGAWQIHTFDTNGPVNVQPNGQAYDQTQLVSSLDYNAKAAVNIYNSQGLGAWSTFTSGAWANYYPGGKSAAVQALLATPLATSSTAVKKEISALSGSTLAIGSNNAKTTTSSSSSSTAADAGWFGIPGAISGATNAVVDAATSLAQELFLGTLAIAFISGGLIWMGAIDTPKIQIGVPAE